MINERKLKAALTLKGATMEDLAKYLNINPATLSRKMHGASDFTRGEIQKTCDYLELDSPVDIFFDSTLA